MHGPGIANERVDAGSQWERYLDKCFNERQRVERAQFYDSISAGRALPSSEVAVTSRK